MKLCINCQNYEKDGGMCVTSANGCSPIDGRPNPRMAIVERSTAPGATCKVDGVNFKPLPKLYFPPSTPAHGKCGPDEVGGEPMGKYQSALSKIFSGIFGGGK